MPIGSLAPGAFAMTPTDAEWDAHSGRWELLSGRTYEVLSTSASSVTVRQWPAPPLDPTRPLLPPPGASTVTHIGATTAVYPLVVHRASPTPTTTESA